MLLQVVVGAAAVELLDACLAPVEVGLGVDDAQHLVAAFKLEFLNLVAQLGPCLTAVGALKERVGHADTLLDVALEGVGTLSGQAVVAGLRTFNRGQTHNLNHLDAGGGVGHHLTRNADNAVENGFVLAEIGADLRLVDREIDGQSALLLTQDARLVVRAVLRNVVQHGVVLFQLAGTAAVVGHKGQHGIERRDVHKISLVGCGQVGHIAAALFFAHHAQTDLTAEEPGMVRAAQGEVVG